MPPLASRIKYETLRMTLVEMVMDGVMKNDTNMDIESFVWWVVGGHHWGNYRHVFPQLCNTLVNHF